MRNLISGLLPASLLLTSCSATHDHFIIEDRDGRIARADVHLCGRVTSLQKHGGEFIGKAKIDCEGSGAVFIQLEDGQAVSCEVGSVTPGATQAFHFALEGSKCQSGGAIGFM